MYVACSRCRGRLLTAARSLDADEFTVGGKKGSFRTAPAKSDLHPVSLLFGSCIGGQGYGRPVETGWRIFNILERGRSVVTLFAQCSPFRMLQPKRMRLC